MKTPVFLFCLLCILVSQVSAGFSSRQPKFDDIKPDKFLALLENATVTINAKISYGEEDQEKIPIAGKFYLLDKSIIEILKESKFDPTGENGNTPSEEDYLKALTNLLLEPEETEEDSLLTYIFWDAVKTHQISVIETNYFGYGKSGKIKTGNYYIFGCEQIEDETFIWNYPVKISGRSLIGIDQYNAE